MDLGSGDAKWPYRLARREPTRLFVAVDLNADALRRTAWRAGRRESKGGARNLICVAARPSELVATLFGAADQITIVLPWGELLNDVVAPVHATLAAIAKLGRSGASFEFVFSHDSRRDADNAAIPTCDAHHMATLEAPYRQAGLEIGQMEEVDQRALLAYPTTWAKRLAHGRRRRVWRLRGRTTG